MIEQLLNDFEESSGHLRLAKHDALALSMSRQNVKYLGNIRTKEEFEFLIKNTFEKQVDSYTFDGKQIYVTVSSDSIFELFNKKKRL